MLSSIHPFGERSRDNSFGHTATAHIVGSTIGGVALGALGALVGLAFTALLNPSDAVRTILLVAATGLAFFFEVTRSERLLPTRTRQVDENWIQTYRGWVYGGGWGAELGFGISTIITTALVHLLVVAMVLSSSPAIAVALGALFGFVRGATILGAARVDTPERLRELHRRLEDLRDRSRSGVLAALVLSMVIGLGAVL